VIFELLQNMTDEAEILKHRKLAIESLSQVRQQDRFQEMLVTNAHIVPLHLITAQRCCLGIRVAGSIIASARNSQVLKLIITLQADNHVLKYDNRSCSHH